MLPNLDNLKSVKNLLSEYQRWRPVISFHYKVDEKDGITKEDKKREKKKNSLSLTDSMLKKKEGKKAHSNKVGNFD